VSAAPSAADNLVREFQSAADRLVTFDPRMWRVSWRITLCGSGEL
jgi:hypothetical protein